MFESKVAGEFHQKVWYSWGGFIWKADRHQDLVSVIINTFNNSGRATTAFYRI